MRYFASQVVVATVGAIAFGGLGVCAAAAADIPLAPRVQQAPEPEYYGNQQPYDEEDYVYQRPPAVYAYPPAPAYRYYYGPPAVAVLPRPYYGRPYPGVVYGRRAYVARSYGPYARHYSRVHRHW